jgi:5-methylcytosine-specific restriction protein A
MGDDMTWGFERGQIYNRRNDIHARFNGQQQGGIITPSNAAVVFAITGEKGLGHGYHDKELPDQTFEYFGAGRFGDMKLTDRNKALYEHSQNGKSLLLFKDEKRQLRFLGEYVCSGLEWRMAPDENGDMRKAIVFKLVPLEKLNEAVEQPPADVQIDEVAIPNALDDLKALAIQASEADPAQRPALLNIYLRSRIVRKYVLARANGRCEYDGNPAPFNREDGTPYLEPHHIERLSDGGPDHPDSIIALCPNCHRRAHSGAGKEQMKAEMIDIVRTAQGGNVRPMQRRA